MATLIAFAIGLILGYRAVAGRWLFVVAAAAVVLEIVVNGVRFGFQTVAIWSIVLTAVTIGAGFAGLRLGTWVRARLAARPRV